MSDVIKKSVNSKKTINFLLIDYIILDNTAFVSGFNPNIIIMQNPDIKIFITSKIYEEAQFNHRSSSKIEIAKAQGILQIKDPSPSALKLVIVGAKESGDIGAISKTDQGIIALYVELHQTYPKLKGIIISDDYSVQNTCAQLHIPFFSYQKQGISRKIRWEIYCPHCYKTYSPELLGKSCEHCGAKLKRRKYRGKRREL